MPQLSGLYRAFQILNQRKSELAYRLVRKSVGYGALNLLEKTSEFIFIGITWAVSSPYYRSHAAASLPTVKK